MGRGPGGLAHVRASRPAPRRASREVLGPCLHLLLKSLCTRACATALSARCPWHMPAAHDAAQPVHTLGPLIHNPRVVCELEREGVGLADSVDDASAGTLVIRAHGVVPQVIDEARDRGLHVIDATCPYVKKVHAAAAKLVAQGYQLIVVGESGHPEVEGILGHAGGAGICCKQCRGP